MNCPKCCETHDKGNPLCLLPFCKPLLLKLPIKPECQKPDCPDCCYEPIPCKHLYCALPQCKPPKPDCPDCCFWPAPCKLIDCVMAHCKTPTCPYCCFDNSCNDNPPMTICKKCTPPPCPECCKDFSCPQPPFPGARTSSICNSIECRCPDCCFNRSLFCNSAQQKLCRSNNCGMIMQHHNQE